jgi:hypothetical protein
MPHDANTLRWNGEQSTACTGPACALNSALTGERSVGLRPSVSASARVNSASICELCKNMQRYTVPPSVPTTKLPWLPRMDAVCVSRTV